MYSTLLCEWRSITDSIHIKGFTWKLQTALWSRSLDLVTLIQRQFIREHVSDNERASLLQSFPYMSV